MRKAALFQWAPIRLASGRSSGFKLECDALTPADWAGIAALARPLLPPFGSVVGVPTGGWALAEALRSAPDPGRTDPVLIVDDVWTTGGSLEAFRERYYAARPVIGLVLFARGPVAAWVTPLFTLNAAAWEL